MHRFLLGKETITEDQQIWDVSPLFCFQNDLPLETVLKVCFKSKYILMEKNMIGKLAMGSFPNYV